MVDEERASREDVVGALRDQGYDGQGAANGGEATDAAKRAAWDVVLLDLGLHDLPGLDVLARIREIDPHTEVVVASACGDTEAVVAALRAGAQGYLPTPATREQVLLAVNHASQRRRLTRCTQLAARGRPSTAGVLGTSPAWCRAVDALHAAARAPRTHVLVRGEAGTGKALAASLLHQWSERVHEPFVAFNAAAVPPEIVEGEIFGHAAEPSNGHVEGKRGLLELAAGGTLFIDEVIELPLDLQTKLVHVLDGQPFRRVGDVREIRTDVRVVSAATRGLEEAVRAGRLRAELLERLQVLEIALPALRERDGDVGILARHFASRLAAEMGKAPVALSLGALAALEAYGWPGNVRELRNVIERAVVLCREGEIGPQDLPAEVRAAASSRAGQAGPGSGPVSTPDHPLRLEEVIRRHVLEVFSATRNNVTRTALALGISRVALRRRLREYGAKPLPSD